MAKGLTSGYSPLGAMAVSDRLVEPFLYGDNTFLHGITFGGHPVSTAVALANIDVFEKEHLLEHVQRNERSSVPPWTRFRPAHRRGRPRRRLLLRHRTGKDKDTRETFDEDECERLLRGFLSGALYEAGLICRADDRGDPVVQLAPPLICGEEEFDVITSILRSVLTEAWKQI